MLVTIYDARDCAGMMMMARDREYRDLLRDLEGQSAVLWTCDTCARMCGVGGRRNAEELASKLFADGVSVKNVVSSSACCLMSKARAMADETGDADLILALCCDIGARNASASSGIPVINPVVTFGPGYLDEGGTPRAAVIVCGNVVRDEPISELIERNGCSEGPFRLFDARPYNKGD